MSAPLPATPVAGQRPSVPIRVVPTNLHGVYASPALPPGFDPRRATRAQLRQYGIFAPRPTAGANPLHRAAWRRVFDRTWRPEDRQVPESRSMPGAVHRLRLVRDRTADSDAQSDNWSGAVVQPTAGRWTSVYGTWSVPGIYKPGTAAGSDGLWDCSAWIGLGGYGTDELFQAGVAQSIGQNNVTEYWPWYEWLVPGYKEVATLFPYVYMTSITNMVVQQNDVVSFGLAYRTETLLIGSSVVKLDVGQVTFGNQTTGQHCSLVLTRPTGAICDGSSAEWIMERYVLPDGTSASMPRYNGIEFQGCLACGAPDMPPGTPGLGFSVDMVENGSVLSDEVRTSDTVVIHYV